MILRTRALPLLLLVAFAACATLRVEPVRPRAESAWVEIGRADALRRAGLREEARRAYGEAIAADPGSVRAHAGLQEIALQEGLDLDLRRTYRSGPDPFLTGRIEGSVARQRSAFDACSEPLRSLGRGLTAQREGAYGRAARAYGQAVQRDPGLSWSRVALGRLLLAQGRTGEAEAQFRAARWCEPGHGSAAIGLGLCADRRGDLAGALAWATIAARNAGGDPAALARLHDVAARSGRREARDEAAGILRGAGEAGAVEGLLLAADLWLRCGEHAAAQEALARARARGASDAEIAGVEQARAAEGVLDGFVRALTRGVEARYRHFAATGEAEEFEQFVVWARSVYERESGRRLAARGGTTEYAFVGKVVDPSLASDEPLVQACAREGLLIVLGQRKGGPPEAMLADVARRSEGEASLRGTTVRREVIWIRRRHLSGYLEWAGAGDIAGIALPAMIVVDLDAVALWEGRIRRRIAAFDRERVLGQEALEDRPVDDLADPGGVAERLYLGGALDIAGEVRVHEEAHLVDAERHLPVESHLLRNLGLALSRGLSTERVLAYLERNAQLTAIAEGPTPRASLATCCAMLDERGAHASGYGEIVAAIVRDIARHPGLYPQVSTDRVIVQQLHRLTDEQIRTAARRVAQRWGLGQAG